MKKRIGTIYNKPIIEGDINLKTINEIHKDELKGGGNGGSVSKYAPRYFKIDWGVASNGWRYLLTIHDSDTPIGQDNILFSIGSTYKRTNEVVSTIATYPFLGVQGGISTERFAFCYTPVYISKEIVEALDISMKVGFYSFEDIIENMPILINLIKGTQVNLSMEGITEITEEDYYKID